MPRERISIKGLMTDLPQDNIPQGACQELVNLRFKDNAWRPAASKKGEWDFGSSNLEAFYKHYIDGATISIGYFDNKIWQHKYNTTSEEWEWVELVNVGTAKINFSSFNRVLVIMDSLQGKIYFTTATISSGDISYSTVKEWKMQAPCMQFSTLSASVIDKYFTTLEDHKLSAKGVYLGIVEEAAKNGRIVGMHFLRCALKLYDGSYIAHSPIRFVSGLHTTNPATFPYGKTPSNTHFDPDDDVSYKWKMQVSQSTINYTIPSTIGSNTANNSDIVDDIKDLSDYIVSLDIFMSDNIEMFDIDDIPMNIDVSDASADYFSFNSLENDELFDQVSNFYLVKSIPINEIEASDTPKALGLGKLVAHSEKVRIDEPITGNSIRPDSKYTTNTFYEYESVGKTDYSNLEANKALNLLEHSSVFTGNVSTVYNKRLFIADIRERLFEGYFAQNFIEAGSGGSASDVEIITLVFLNTEDGEKVVQSSSSYSFENTGQTMVKLPLFITHPDIRASKIRLFASVGGSYFVSYKEYSLQKHPFLNVAYCATSSVRTSIDSVNLNCASLTTGALTAPSIFVNDENALLVSETNNPFIYRAINTNHIGLSRIVSLLSNTVQMSEGQFGLHPLFVFTENGIYALKIGLGNAFIESIQPVSSDNCLGGAISFYSRSMGTNVMLYLSRTGVKFLRGKDSSDITQFVKNNTIGVLDFLKKLGYTDSDNYGNSADPMTDLTVGQYATLTADISSIEAKTGNYVVRVNNTGTITTDLMVYDRSYYYFTGFDNYFSPKTTETNINTNYTKATRDEDSLDFKNNNS